ncbi:MAG TPA: choice-of-anchor F family protein [Phycisphaerae bacterium]|nr:choice-of-anchor F family protein [Phycisphaerae bacterium]
MHPGLRRHSAFVRVSVLALVAAAALLHPVDAQGGVITALTWHSGVASVAGDIIMPPSAPNNDNQVGVSPNLVQVLQKNYVGIGPVDLVFTVADTGGTTEYRMNEGVANNTGIAWSDYHMELGFGFGSGFVPATPGGGLDFDAPDHDSPVTMGPGFPGFLVTELEIFASGFLPNTAFNGGMIFHLDVPDGVSEFTLRQSPVPVPEPTTVVMLLCGLGLLRRRTRQVRG